MREKQDLKHLTELWFYLTPTQRKILTLQACLYRTEITVYLLAIRLFVYIARLVVPIPQKIVKKIHWL